MKNVNILKKVALYTLIFIYALAGIATIIFAVSAREKDGLFLGTMVIVSSTVHILLYFLKGGYKNNEKSFYIVIGLVALSLGIVFIASENLSVSEICLYWGILDIVRSSCEVKDALLEMRQSKGEIISLFIALGDIALGILLCIHLEHGIMLHLTYFGIAFILSAIKEITEEVIRIRIAKKTNV